MLIRLCQCRTYSQASTSAFNLQTIVSHYESKDRLPKKSKSSKTFHMVLPPPNVTGNLHLGHALTVTIEDAVCRFQRLLGDEVIWYPGFDHAGIATQTVVERKLFQEKGILRRKMTPEQFLSHCEKWKNDRVMTITTQLKRMGTLLNWNRSYYTMDEKFSRVVRHAFCHLHKEGLIFRDKRLINWCPALKSSISDQEVEKEIVYGATKREVPDGMGNRRKIEFGAMHVINYEVLDRRPGDPNCLEVGTTKPETIFADVALAVNPDDSRFNFLVGRRVRNPLTKNAIPIIADEAVIMDYATVTPAHDFNDFKIAQRHLNELDPDLVYFSCVDKYSRITGVSELPEFQGLDRYEAREKVVTWLKDQNLYAKQVMGNATKILLCSRTGSVIEPVLMEQWFLRCDEMHAEALKALERGEFILESPGVKQILVEWLNNSEPWCLSRQLLWGHRIPAYLTPNNRWLIAPSELEARSTYKLDEDVLLKQDSDVLDTWFSSALIPLIVRGWPDKPVAGTALDLMETGHDILGFWVARMLILCKRLSGNYPFKKILLHSLVRDSTGRKMSKSLGNVIDPLDVIDGISHEAMLKRLKESALGSDDLEKAEHSLNLNFPNGLTACGADALRYALLRHDLTALDCKISVETLSDEGRRFCIKLWNLTKYAQTVFEKASPCDNFSEPNGAIDVWLENQFAQSLEKFQKYMKEHELSKAFQALRFFIVNELCDVYLETTKKPVWNNDVARTQQISNVLYKTLQSVFVSLSIFMPHISEYCYDQLPNQTTPLDEFQIDMLRSFKADEKINEGMNFSRSVIESITDIRKILDLKQNFLLEGIIGSRARLPDQTKELVTILSDLKYLKITEFREDSSSTIPGFIPFKINRFDATLHVNCEPSKFPELMQNMNIEIKKWKNKQEESQVDLEKYEKLYQKQSADKKTKKSQLDHTQFQIKRANNHLSEAQSKLERIEQLIMYFENRVE